MLDHLLPVPEGANPDLWAIQIALERGAVHEGAELAKERHDKATDKNQMASTEPGRKLVRQALPKLVEGMKEWMRVATRQRGPKPVVIRYLSTQTRSELMRLNPVPLKSVHRFRPKCPASDELHPGTGIRWVLRSGKQSRESRCASG